MICVTILHKFRMLRSCHHFGVQSKVFVDNGCSKVSQTANCIDLQKFSLSRDELYHLLQECTKRKDLPLGRQVRSLMIDKGLDTITVLGDHLVRMFASCGSLSEAKESFDCVPKPSVYTWNAIIAAHVTLGDSAGALGLFHKMQQEDIKPVKITFLHILKACANIKDVCEGRVIHEQIVRGGLELDIIIGSAVVVMYGKCGSVEEGCNVFDRMPNRDVVSWGAVIGGLMEHGHNHLALEYFERMQEDGVKPNAVVFLCIFKACAGQGTIKCGQVMHRHVISCGLDVDQRLGNSLIDMYAKCGSTRDAHKVFCGMVNKNVMSWGALITGYVQNAQYIQAFDLLNKMQEKKEQISEIIFDSILKACGSTSALQEGRQVHDLIIKAGCESDVGIECSLIDMYAKCKSVDEAHNTFASLDNPNWANWNAMIEAYNYHGLYHSCLEAFSKMEIKGIKITGTTLINVIKACASSQDLRNGRLVHDRVLRSSFDADVIVGSSLVNMYAKCGSLCEACQVFEKLPERDLVSWSSVIACYAEQGHLLHALSLFEELKGEGLKPDEVIYSCVLKVCGNMKALDLGRLIHEEVSRSRYKFDAIVGSTLIDMYAKCGSLSEAYEVFHMLPHRDTAVWGALIAGYVEYEHFDTAFGLLLKMLQDGLTPSKVICLCILKACILLQLIDQGMLIHSWIMEIGFETDVTIGSALVDMYVTYGCLEEARTIFFKLSNRDVVSWSTMIAGYVLHEDGVFALELFEKMLQEGIKPDKIIFLSSVKACLLAGALVHGRLMHKQILLAGYGSDVDVGTALVDMYAKCGHFEDAYNILHKLPGSNVVSWGAVIAGFATHANGRIVIDWIQVMQQQGIKPDGVVFLSILVACSHAGLLEEGRQFFTSMREDYGILPSLKHYNCLVDLLCRAGYLNEAQDLLQCMPTSTDVTGWLALLTGCRNYGNLSLGKHCYNKVMELDPIDASGYMLVSKMYSDAHLWEIVDRIQKLRSRKGAWKKPGRACVEVNGEVHEFVVNVQTQRNVLEGSGKFTRLGKAVKKEGYVPESDLVWEPD